MKNCLLMLLLCLSACGRQPADDARQWLDTAQRHADRGESLSEDSLVCRSLEYYRGVTPQDTTLVLQAAHLTAQHYWWKGAKGKSYELLEEAVDTYRPCREWKIYQDLLLTLVLQYYYDNHFEESRQRLTELIDLTRDEGTKLEYENARLVLSYFLNDTLTVQKGYEELLPRYLEAQPDSTPCFNFIRNYATIQSSYGNQRKAIELQRLAMNYIGTNNVQLASSYACLARYYLLLDDLGKAEHYLRLADATANTSTRSNWSYAGQWQLLQATFEYAKHKSINTLEWAKYLNQLEMEENRKKQIERAKDESNRLLTERNLKLTISRQRTQLITLYALFALGAAIAVLAAHTLRKKRALQEKEEELEALRRLIADSRTQTEQKDDRFFKRILLQQLGVIRLAAANPTTANQELLKRMTAIANKEVEVDALLNWEDLYTTIDYIYDGYHTRLVEKYGALLNEKEIQLCCLLRANFSTKEISIVTQQGIRTVYQRKTVIRQKLGMEEKGDIAEFLE